MGLQDSASVWRVSCGFLEHGSYCNQYQLGKWGSFMLNPQGIQSKIAISKNPSRAIVYRPDNDKYHKTSQ
jgi:hypothetical protein